MPGRMTPEQVAACISAYQGELASPAHVPLIRELVSAITTDRRSVVRQSLSALSGLIYWCEQQGLPITADRILDLDLIDRYAAHGVANLAHNTSENTRLALRRIARARHGPFHHPSQATGPYLRDSKAPYTRAETDNLLAWAAAGPSERQRQAQLAVCALGFGGGLAPQDIVGVHGNDLHKATDGTVTVTVRGPRPRTATLLSRYEELALRLAATADTGWIVNAAIDPDRPDIDEVLTNQLRAGNWAPTTGPLLTMTRARITWICLHLTAGTPLHVLADAAGVDTRQLVKYCKYLEPPNEAARNAMLRNP